MLTRLRLRDLVEELAEPLLEVRQTKKFAPVHRLSKQLPPLCHEVIADLKERFTGLRPARVLGGVDHHLQNPSCSELRIPGHAYGAELYELDHLFGNFWIFDKSPAATRMEKVSNECSKQKTRTCKRNDQSSESLPNACPGMPGGFRDGEQSQIMVSGRRNGGILWPVVGQVMNQYTSSSVDHGVPDKSIRVVGGGH